jgi:LPS sulfotransferase NodH
MHNKSTYPPVIILGMHRSGTTMLTRLLEEAGLFLGVEKEANNEALFFLHLNEWILKRLNGSWNTPWDVIDPDEETRNEIIGFLEGKLSSRSRASFLGRELYSSYKSVRDVDFPWGWKDPRNTLTALLWGVIFPEAKFLHIYRNPIDIAESLRKRETKMYKNRYKRLLKKLLTMDFTKDYLSKEMMSIHAGIKLWGDYTRRALMLGDIYPGQILHFKYEEFLDNPVRIINEIFDFIGLKADPQRIQNLCQSVNLDRKYAFLKKDELLEVYADIKKLDIVKRLKYDEIFRQ